MFDPDPQTLLQGFVKRGTWNPVEFTLAVRTVFFKENIIIQQPLTGGLD